MTDVSKIELVDYIAHEGEPLFPTRLFIDGRHVVVNEGGIKVHEMELGSKFTLVTITLPVQELVVRRATEDEQAQSKRTPAGA